jgi:DNA-binding NarL/FixJ family response regulator
VICLVLVEDHPQMRESVTGLLKAGFPDAQIQSFGDAETALAFCAGEKVAVVISDIALPGLSGMALLEILRREQPALPVILQTLYDMTEHRELATLLGAYALLEKGRLAQDLVPAVQRALVKIGAVS